MWAHSAAEQAVPRLWVEGHEVRAGVGSPEQVEVVEVEVVEVEVVHCKNERVILTRIHVSIHCPKK